jgi:hypothetical protein
MAEHRYLEYIAAFAAGALSPSELAEFEAHRPEECEICQPELYSLSETAARLPYSLPNRPLPAGLKEKIRKALPAESRATSKASFSQWILPIAAILLLALLLPIVWRKNAEITERDKAIADLKKYVEQQRQEIAWLRDPSVQLALLTGLTPAPGAKGKMIWNPNQSKGIFYANDLPSLQSGKSYQLWVIGKKGPVSAGVFDPNPEGSAVITISRIEGSAEGSLQFAVTIEPRGGVPQPTGSMVLAGKPL